MKGNISIDFCDYCFLSHEKIYKTHDNFQFIKKASVDNCVGCGSCMCQDCVDVSAKYIKGSPLQKYHFSLCAGCILEKWSDKERRETVFSLVAKHEEKMQEELQEEILLLSKSDLSGKSPPPSNNISTSIGLLRDNIPQQPLPATYKS